VFGVSQDTIELAISLVDRYLNWKNVKKDIAQLLTAAAYVVSEYLEGLQEIRV
jgi:hypothetical protein